MKRVIAVASLLVICRGVWAAPQVAVAVNHFCALGDKSSSPAEMEKVGPASGKAGFCWDSGGNILSIPINLKDPTSIVAGARLGGLRGDYSCVIDEGSVRCWGKLADRINEKFKDFRHATLLSAGSTDICAYDEELMRMECEGGPAAIQWTKIASAAPKNERFIALDVGTFYACGVNGARQTKCWGGVSEVYRTRVLEEPLRSQLGQGPDFLNVPVPEIPPKKDDDEKIAISVGMLHACHNVNGMGNCWGLERAGEVEVKDAPADYVDASVFRTCLVNQGNFSCRGIIDNNLKSLIQRSQNFALSIVGNKEDVSRDRSTCIATDNEVKCFGKINAEVKVSMVGLNLTELDREFRRMSYYAYKEKADIMKKAAALIEAVGPNDGDQQKIDARLFVLVGLKGLVTNIDSEFFEKDIRPRYEYMHEVYGNKYRAKSLESLKGERTGQVALELLKSTLEAVETHIVLNSEKEQLGKYLGRLTREISIAGVRRVDYRDIGTTGRAALREITDRLTLHPRYRGIAMTMAVLTAFLADF